LLPVAWDVVRTLYLILYIVAAVMFAVAIFIPAPVAGNPPSAISRVNLIAVGLLSWVLVDVVRQFDLVAD